MRTFAVMAAVLTLVLAFAVLVQCAKKDANRGDDDAAGDDSSGAVRNPSQSDCQSGGKGDGYTKEEAFTIRFADGVLLFHHDYSCRNCGFAFHGAYEVAGDSVSVYEEDVSPVPAGCDCFFSLDYEVPGVQAGATYVARVYGVDHWEGASGEPWLILERTLDLSTQTEFTFSLGEKTCI